jgi:hypothetical protein
MTRFALQWLVPRQAARLTHVMLLDRARPAPFTLAAGHGADKLHALLNLWETLVQDGESAEAIDYVAVEYTRRSGTVPTMTIGRRETQPGAKPLARPTRKRRKR